MLKAQIFNIQRFSIQDGPGIRTTVFFKGCPLSCDWCCNPESQRSNAELMYREKSCQTCGTCVAQCQKNAIDLQLDKIIIDRELCNSCFECVEVCCSGALEITGKSVTIEEVLDEVTRDKLFYRNSGGGVTLSGGEPLFQAHFVKELLKALKRHSIDTTIDTCGFVKWEDFEGVLPFTDRVLFDLKHLNSQDHKSATGVENDLILANLEKLLHSGKTSVWIRIPVISGFNNSKTLFQQIAVFLKNKPVEKISLLPYHTFGSAKYTSLGKTIPCQQLKLIDDNQIEILKTILEKGGNTVTIGS